MDGAVPFAAAVAAFAAALEGSAFGHFVRSSMLAYPLANLLHVAGAALLVGAVAVFDVAVLRRAALAPVVVRAGIPVAAFGLALALPSGAVLFSAEATALVRNPVFGWKLGIILIGLANVAALHLFYGRRLKTGADLPRWPAAVSIGAWAVALLLGRTIAYV